MNYNGILIDITLVPHQLNVMSSYCIGLSATADPSRLKLNYAPADKKTSLPIEEPLHALFSGCLAEHLESVGLHDFYVDCPYPDHWKIRCEVDDVLAAQTISVLFMQLTAGINTHITISERSADGTFLPVAQLPSIRCRTALNIDLRLMVTGEREGVSLSFSADKLSPILAKFPEWAQASIPQHNRLLAAAVRHALGGLLIDEGISIASKSNTVSIEVFAFSEQQRALWVTKAKTAFCVA